MKGNMEDRAERLALYIIENRTTVRAAAQKFGISKSTVHTDVTKKNGPRFTMVPSMRGSKKQSCQSWRGHC